MVDSFSTRRIAENEVVFRRENENVIDGLVQLIEMAKEDGQEELLGTVNRPLMFYCECSDEDCRKRIKLTPQLYSIIHKQRKAFIVLPGHEVKLVERVKSIENEYYIVEKFIEPDKNADMLHRTEIRN